MVQTCHFIGDSINGSEYDVAHVKWSGSWRMPTNDQIEELVNHSTSTWTKYNPLAELSVLKLFEK